MTPIEHTLDNLVHLDFSTLDVAAAHRELGRDAGPQVRAILGRALDRLGRAELALQIRRVRECRAAIDHRLGRADLDPPIRAALGEYVRCLSAWAEGAGLAQFAAENSSRLEIDGARVSADELALWLQGEQCGCQTGVYRDEDGSIILWHTEEDVEASPGSRFDRRRLFSYRTSAAQEGPVVTSFIYPDLLPGPMFAWSSDRYIQAVDSLFVRVGDLGNAIFPNVVAWLRLYLGRAIDTEGLIGAMAPYLGGYAMITVHRDERGWQADKTEFAGDQSVVVSLAHQPGDYLFQVNVFSDPASPIALAYEEIKAARRPLFERRIARTARSMAVIRRSPDKVGCFRRLLASRAGAEWAYSNLDVKATFLCQAADPQPRMWVGVGPGARDGRFWMVSPYAAPSGRTGEPAL